MRHFALVIVAACCGVAAADSGRVLRTEVVVDATPAQLWDAFTTKAGWESWAVALAEVDFRIGGTIRTNYNKEAGIGGPGTITHHILAYEPQKMLATRFDAPANAGWAKIAEGCWVVTRFEPVSPTQTRMVETMVGWGEGAEWDESYDHFKKGNEWSAQQLKKKFAASAPAAAKSDPDAVLSLLRTMVGGEWIHEGKGPDGGTFRVRNTSELLPDGKGLLKRGWLGDDSGMYFHASTQVWREADDVRFQDVSQSGALARGTIRKTSDKAVEWDWHATTPDGKESRYTVTMTFDAPDSYTMLLTETLADGATRQVVNPTFKRVAKAPPQFLKLRGQPAASESAMTTIDCSRFPASGFVTDPLIKETTIKASPMDAFKSFATAEGLKGFLVQDCKVDLRVGGPFELYFAGPDVPQDQRGSNGCQVLSYVPGEMLSFSWNAPPKFPEERAQRAWVVLTFTPEGPGATKVRLVHTGFGSGGHWPEVRQYFDSAWTNVLKALKEHYEK